jgi:hypothetical protein
MYKWLLKLSLFLYVSATLKLAYLIYTANGQGKRTKTAGFYPPPSMLCQLHPNMHLLKIANEKRLKRPSKQPFAHFSRNTATGLLRPSSGKKYLATPLRQHFCGKRKRAASLT